jgi:hypothetical protein
MRILIVGAAGTGRTEHSLVRAAQSLGHSARLFDVPGWRRRIGRWADRLLHWQADRFGPDLVLCTRHAAGLEPPSLDRLFRHRASAFWYFDAGSPLPPPVIQLGCSVEAVYATYGYQCEAFRAGGAGRALFLPQGADPTLDAPAQDAPAEYRCDLSFVGSGQYPRRHRVLVSLARHCRLQVRGPGWENAPPGVPVAGGRVRGAAFSRVVRGAAVSLGINALEDQARETRGGTSNRLWRVLAAGGVFLGERTGGVETFAIDGVHARWYASEEEATSHLRTLLAEPDVRARLALAGRAHVLASHTYAHRLALLLAGQGYTTR